jgi:hypothetical protein
VFEINTDTGAARITKSWESRKGIKKTRVPKDIKVEAATEELI